MGKLEYQVIIAGSGPAGSSAATVLGQAGKKVLLLDKKTFPRDKTCGDGITFKCIDSLKKLGVLDTFLNQVQYFVRGYSMFFSDGSELTVRRPINEQESIIYILPRYDFDNIIFKNAIKNKNVNFIADCKAKKLVMNNNCIVGIEADFQGKHTTFEAPLIIDATGANSSLAVQAGAGNQNPRHSALALRGYYENVDGLNDTVEFYFDRSMLPGYFWIFPTSATTANFGCGTFQHIVKKWDLDLHDSLQGFIKNHPVANRKLKNAKLVGKLKGGKIPLALDSQKSRVRSGFMMIGDAAAFTDPITAEGISYALISGILGGETAAQAIEKQNYSSKFLGRFNTLWKEKFGKQFSKSTMLTELTGEAAFETYLISSFSKNKHAQIALQDFAGQYELMFKLKSLMKAI